MSATTPGPSPDGRTVQQDEALETFTVFTVDDRSYALAVEHVTHVLPLPRYTRAPAHSPHLLGVFHRAGRIMPLWDAHRLFAADGPPPVRPVVLVLERGTDAIGLAVDQIDEVVTVPPTERAPIDDPPLPPPLAHLLVGWLRVRDPAPYDREPRVPVAARADAATMDTLLAAAGRPDRGAAILALHAPVHLIDIDALFAHLLPDAIGGDDDGRS